MTNGSDTIHDFIDTEFTYQVCASLVLKHNKDFHNDELTKIVETLASFNEEKFKSEEQKQQCIQEVAQAINNKLKPESKTTWEALKDNIKNIFKKITGREVKKNTPNYKMNREDLQNIAKNLKDKLEEQKGRLTQDVSTPETSLLISMLKKGEQSYTTKKNVTFEDQQNNNDLPTPPPPKPSPIELQAIFGEINNNDLSSANKQMINHRNQISQTQPTAKPPVPPRPADLLQRRSRAESNNDLPPPPSNEELAAFMVEENKTISQSSNAKPTNFLNELNNAIKANKLNSVQHTEATAKSNEKNLNPIAAAIIKQVENMGSTPESNEQTNDQMSQPQVLTGDRSKTPIKIPSKQALQVQFTDEDWAKEYNPSPGTPKHNQENQDATNYQKLLNTHFVPSSSAHNKKANLTSNAQPQPTRSGQEMLDARRRANIGSSSSSDSDSGFVSTSTTSSNPSTMQNKMTKEKAARKTAEYTARRSQQQGTGPNRY